MLLAALEPGQDMAIANFFLAIFCLFTVTLPLLLVTRGDKTESNRDFIAATVNPWSQIRKEIELTPVVISGITPIIKVEPQLEIIDNKNDEAVLDSGILLSKAIKVSDDPEKSEAQSPSINDEVLAA